MSRKSGNRFCEKDMLKQRVQSSEAHADRHHRHSSHGSLRHDRRRVVAEVRRRRARHGRWQRRWISVKPGNIQRPHQDDRDPGREPSSPPAWCCRSWPGWTASRDPSSRVVRPSRRRAPPRWGRAAAYWIRSGNRSSPRRRPGRRCRGRNETSRRGRVTGPSLLGAMQAANGKLRAHIKIWVYIPMWS